MSKTINNWIDFWDHQTVMDDDSWRKNSELLIEGCQPFFSFESDDRVLDIGAGPGLLADALVEKVKEIHSLDTSERYVSEGNQRFEKNPNAQFDLLGENYLDFSCLGEKTFSKILCASVIQYYKNIGEVETLILEMKKRSLPGGRMLIADIAVEHNLFVDLSGLLTTAWKKKYLLNTIGFILQSFRGDYSRIRKELGLLSIKKSDLDAIIKKHDLKAEWRKEILSLNKSRRHLLIHF